VVVAALAVAGTLGVEALAASAAEISAAEGRGEAGEKQRPGKRSRNRKHAEEAGASRLEASVAKIRAGQEMNLRRAEVGGEGKV